MLPQLHVLALNALLVGSVTALGAAALRAASAVGARGLVRVVAAAPLAASAAVTEAVALGLFGLGGTPIALGTAALATWLVSRMVFDDPPSLWDEAVRGASQLSRRDRIALGAGVGLALAYTAWALRRPELGLDAAVWHVTEAVMWAQQGTPGSVELVNYDFPYGSYPVTNEVLVSWMLGISNSLPPAVVWSPLLVGLSALAAWVGLRNLAVSWGAALLAVAALLAIPALVEQAKGPGTDVPALAWLLCTATLALLARRTPGLLVPALIAGGLAIGTKTTPAPLVVVCLVAGAYSARKSLAALRSPLTGAVLMAVAAGGIWNLRTLFEHGSPFWPFMALPGGDPVPPYLDRMAIRLVERPVDTISGRLQEYFEFFAGGLVLLAAAPLIALLVRRRAVVAAGAVSLLGTLLWASTPYTGEADVPERLQFAVYTTRYLLPVTAAAALTLALASRERGLSERVAPAMLALAVVASVVAMALPGGPRTPPELLLVAGAVVGAAVGANASGLSLAASPRLASPVLAAVAAIGLALSAPTFVARYAATGAIGSGAVARLANDRAFKEGSQPFSFAPTPVAVMAGDRLQHRLEVAPADESCAGFERRRRSGLLIVRSDPLARFMAPSTVSRCVAGVRPTFEDSGGFRVYGRLLGPSP